MDSAEKVCIIGAGCSGIVACQVLARGGSPSTASRRARVGGNWRYENDNGMSSAYRSLHINTSRRVMAYKSLPMPDHYPDYPEPLADGRLLRRFADHFGLRGEDHLPHRGRRRSSRSTARLGGDRRGPRRGARPTATARSWSPTATTGTRAGRSRPSPAPTSSRASRSTPTTTASPTSARQAGARARASATPPSTSRSSRRGSPRRPSSPCAAAPTSCRSTSTASRSTKRRQPDHVADCRSRCSASSRCGP